MQSISVIPDQILRSTYLTDLAQRIGMKEQTLIAELNKRVRRNMEEEQKSRERESNRSTNAQEPTSSEPPAAQQQPTPISVVPQSSQPVPHLHTPQEQASQVEQLLMREIVRHGEEIIFDNVETDDGDRISLSVAQYINLDLSQDGLQFAVPIHQRMLEEVLAHQGEPGFKAETYFCSHPDISISQLATRLAIDRHQLGGRFVVEPREGSLRQRILHQVKDYRLNILKQKLKAIEQQMQQVNGDKELTMKLLKDHKETKELRDMLAKQLGSDLMV